MGIEKKQVEALKALKVFNNAVTTSRLYPENSPQVSASIEKAHDAVTGFLKANGELSLGRSGDSPRLCGFEIPEAMAADLLELVIYRHLNLLKLDHVVMWPTLDRTGFEAILAAFVARKEAIDKEGGGRPFVDGLGLEQFFPHEYQPKHETPEAEPLPDFDLEVDTSNIPDGVLDFLLGESEPDRVHGSLELLFSDAQQASEVILAGVARILAAAKNREDKSGPLVSESYSHLLRNVEGLIESDRRDDIAAATAALFFERMSDPLIALIYVQRYPKGFGQELFDRLTLVMPNDRFDAVVRQMHRWVRHFIKQKRTKEPVAQLVGLTLKGVLETPKGKQFVGREKARSLMKSGEQERREKRLETGIGTLMGGGKASLRSEEVLAGLPSEVDKLLSQNKGAEVNRIIIMMSEEMLGNDTDLHPRLIAPLVSIGEKLLEKQQWSLLENCSDAYLKWIRESDSGDGIYKRAALILIEVMNHAWQDGNYVEGDKILQLFHQIRTAQIAKSDKVTAIVGDVQDRTYNRPFYQALLDGFLETPSDATAGQRLIMMGRPAGDFILEKLLQEEEPANRLKIVDLLGNMGPVAKDLILEKLPQPMPWYGKRNLLKLAGAMAGPEQVDAIYPFLRHDDIRVQREAFVSIYTMSGGERKQALIRCLSESSEAMRSQVVKALLPYSDAETAHHLSILLQDQEHYSEDIREPLIREIINVLSRSQSAEGRDALLGFLETRDKKINRKLNQSLWRAAELAARQVDERLTEIAASAPSRRAVSMAAKQGTTTSDDGGPDQAAEVDFDNLPGVIRIREMVEQDRVDSAKEMILKLIAELASKNMFEEAEKLRTWLVEIDPMALSEIIQAAEIIEEEKIAAIDKVDIEAWSELYDELSTEEFATFIHATERRTYSNEEMIFVQGDMQSGLYFINSGSVKVFYQDNAEEKLIKTAEKGDILGADTVVDASVWTMSAACLTPAEVMYLGGSEFQRWREEYPALESKISDFCKSYASMEDYFASSDRDRRAAKRYGLNGKVTSVLLDDQLRDTGFSTQGDLYDVSRGGLSFFMRISQKKHARVLLGRNIKVMVPMEGAAGRQVDILGIIIAARSRQNAENEYSIHIKFSENLSSADLQAIIKTNV